GRSLKDFKIVINFGIKTGYNEAFIINEQTKGELVSKSPDSINIIKPILRGRDLKKYTYEFSGMYLLNTHNGVVKNNIERIKVKEDYPLIYDYLASFMPQVEQRQDKGKHWTNLRNCAYLEDFEKPKIIWGEISDKPKFAFDDSNYYAEATTFLMTGEKLKYLLGILNSKLSEWYFNQISTTTGMGTNRWKKYKIEIFPIKEPTEIEESSLEKLVDEILTAKKGDRHADTSELEKAIDRLVYKLYQLTYHEVKIIDPEFALTEQEYTAIKIE
ncbi:MAG: TaqI-like C-terminal specificity domain-containing protein, partial [Pseudanabaena sp.]